MIFRPIIISHCCCTEFSDSLCGSNSIVPTLPSSSGKQLFHPTSLETEDRRGTIRHKNQEKEQSSSQAFSFITHKLFIQCIIWHINHQKNSPWPKIIFLISFSDFSGFSNFNLSFFFFSQYFFFDFLFLLKYFSYFSPWFSQIFWF